MTFSPQWSEHYDTRPFFDRGRYPYFEKTLDIFVADCGRTLELGCAFGANVPYFAHRHADYHGVDGSDKAIGVLLDRHPQLVGKVMVGDFTKAIPFEPGFDLIVDRASMPHNDIASIKRAADLIYDALKPGGLFIAADWFSTWHSEYRRGTVLERGTRTDYPDGQFRGVGKVHFSDDDELSQIFSRFEGVHLEERCTRRVGPCYLVQKPVKFRWISEEYAMVDYRSAVWDFVVRKPK